MTVGHAPHGEQRIASEPVALPGGGHGRRWPVANRIGESPVWHRGRGALLWIDIAAQALLSLAPAEGRLGRWALPATPGALVPRGGAQVWLALRHEIAEMDLATGALRTIAPVEAGSATNRLNDGCACRSGRWWVFGSMHDAPAREPTGALYRIGLDGQVERLWDGLCVANGIAFSLDGGTLYFSDSHSGQLFAAPWDAAAGRLAGPAWPWALLDDAAGRPDGACVDAQGHYWSAGVSAGVLHRLDAGGRVVQRLAVPCRAPTKPAFGGARAEQLFVTSLVRPQWATPGPADGALLQLPAPAPGRLQDDLLPA